MEINSQEYIVKFKIENGVPIFGETIRKDKWIRRKKLKKLKKISKKNE